MTRDIPTDAEIAVLEALAAQGEFLASVPDSVNPPFRTRLRLVDPGRKFLILACSGDKNADAAVLAQPRVDILVEWGEWRIAFAASAPVAVTHDGIAAIRVQFPESVSISRRRMFARAAVPEHSQLRCVAYSGAVPIFEASIIDMSQGGIGIQTESAGDELEPGMVLAACRLERPGHEPVVVDLEVRHTATTRRPDGRRTMRAGCRFVNLSPAAMGLIAEYFAAMPPGGGYASSAIGTQVQKR